MPTARMAQDGDIGVTVAALTNIQRYNFDLQVTPWLEGTFRYGHVAGTNHFSDYHRNIGFKIRLWDETANFPAVSLGARDVIGTGRQGAEYLVASKQIWDFDLTAGIGWGRLAGNGVFRNPFAILFKSFETRSAQPLTGGTPAFGQLFHGPRAGVFGGFDYRTPIPGLDLLAEYSSDDYGFEKAFGVIHLRAPVDVGISYAPFDNLRLTGGWFYGKTYGFTVAYVTNPVVPSKEPRIGPQVPPPAIRTQSEQLAAIAALEARNGPRDRLVSSRERVHDEIAQALLAEARGVRDLEIDGRTLLVSATYYENAEAQCQSYAKVAAIDAKWVDTVAITDPADQSGSVALCKIGPATLLKAGVTSQLGTDAQSTERRIRADVAAQQLQIDAFAIQGSELWLYYRNPRYRSETEAAGRIARVLMKNAPPGVEIFHLTLVQFGLAIREFRFARTALERAVLAHADAGELGDAVAFDLPPVDQPLLDRALQRSEPRFAWSIGPGLKQSFFDPKSPIEVELYAAARADVELMPGIDLNGQFDVNIANNFNVNRGPGSVLPHVRTDIGEYLKKGKDGIEGLELDVRRRLAPDLYAKLKVGYLEDMYGGVGGEILWRPEGERFAIGADVYEVWKRNFDRLFGFQNYRTLTGHISIYYNSPWHGLNFNVHLGRYLARDYGGTIEITREFATGVEIGAFATFTNVPFSKFGEGSFDKGFIVRIPFEWSLPVYTKTEKYTLLHSLARDGGQRLYDDDSLHEDTRDASYGELSSNAEYLTQP